MEMNNLVKINDNVSLPYGSKIIFEMDKPCPLCGKIIDGDLSNVETCHNFILSNSIKFYIKILEEKGFKVEVNL